MRVTLCVLIVMAGMGCSMVQAGPKVHLGVDVLIADEFKPLAGKRVGLITNPTGVTRDLRSTIDVLHGAENVKLVALFGPEHGVRGDAYGGDKVADTRDPKSTRRMRLNAHVAKRRNGERWSLAPGARFDASTMSASSSRRSASATNSPE